MVGPNRALFRRALGVLIAGVALAAVAQSRLDAGHPAGFDIVAAGAASATGAPSASVSSAAPPRFRISGSVSGLYPGAALPLELQVSNPQPFAIVVTSITTTVVSSSHACTSSNLTVTRFAGSLVVPGRGAANVAMTATLRHSAPNACQGVVFRLHYAGTAVKQ